MRIQRLVWTAAVALACVPAMAHDTAVPHVHPHGSETAILAIILGVAALGLWKSGILSTIRKDR